MIYYYSTGESYNQLYFKEKEEDAAEKVLTVLCWEVKDLSDLLEAGRNILVEISLILDALCGCMKSLYLKLETYLIMLSLK